LAASVHTRSEEAFDRCQRALECGVVNWNAPTVGASGRLPFGGLKRSGNHRPAALFSTLYCAAPVAVMRGEPVLDRNQLAPGIAWVDECPRRCEWWSAPPATSITARPRWSRR